MFGISILSNLEFCTETLNQQSNKGLVVLLELLSLCGYFFNDGLKLDTRAVLRFDELTDGFVEFFRISIEINIEISELIEDEFFSLPVFKEKQGNQILVFKLYELLGGKSWMLVIFLLAEIILKHEFMHRCV